MMPSLLSSAHASLLGNTQGLLLEMTLNQQQQMCQVIKTNWAALQPVAQVVQHRSHMTGRSISATCLLR
jgi:hypothetical protein